MKTTKDLFDKSGGSIQLAALLGVNQWTVERWHKTGIPFKYWEKIIKAYGVTPAQLMEVSNRAIKDFKNSVK